MTMPDSDLGEESENLTEYGAPSQRQRHTLLRQVNIITSLPFLIVVIIWTEAAVFVIPIGTLILALMNVVVAFVTKNGGERKAALRLGGGFAVVTLLAVLRFFSVL